MMPSKLRRKRFIARKDFLDKLCVWLGITRVWITTEKSSYPNSAICERLNPWNPLTYLAILIALFVIMISAIGNGWSGARFMLSEINFKTTVHF